jgi:hypothetical protein
MTPLEIALAPFKLILIVADLWWIYLPIILWKFSTEMYLNYKVDEYIANNWEQVFLEVSLQKTLEKSPKAMEQVFLALHSVQEDIDWQDKWLKGKIPHRFSFEMVGIDGQVHFVIRTQKEFQRLVQSAIYAQFKDVEIFEVDDYVEKFDRSRIGVDVEMWGCDMKLAKPDGYPIRTYEYFMESDAPGMIIDPLSQLTEVLSNLEKGEQFWVQIPIAVASDRWVKSGEKERDRLLGKDVGPGPSWVDNLFTPLLSTLTFGLIQNTAIKKASSSDSVPAVQKLSPGQTLALKAIEASLTKPAFTTKVRLVYLAELDKFKSSSIAGVLGGFRQYSDITLNYFEVDSYSVTDVKKWFNQASTQKFRKNILFDNYRRRKITSGKYNLNVEELATIYHFPGESVTATTLTRVNSKKATPPQDLPIINS